jgi:hypothetical protein
MAATFKLNLLPPSSRQNDNQEWMVHYLDGALFKAAVSFGRLGAPCFLFSLPSAMHHPLLHVFLLEAKY